VRRARQAASLSLVRDIVPCLKRRLVHLFIATCRCVGWHLSRIPGRSKGTIHGWRIRSSERESPPVCALATVGSAILPWDILAL
jgi:hypothetical protein